MAAGRILSVAESGSRLSCARRPTFDSCENSRGSLVFHGGRSHFRRSPWRALQSEWMSMTGISSGEAILAFVRLRTSGSK